MFSDPVNTQQRLDLMEGFTRDLDINEIPFCINDLCLGYKSKAIKWIIKNQDLDDLLSINNHKIYYNKYLETESFIFSLSLENKDNHIIFTINPLKSQSQCGHRIYCELYCIETQTQYKRTHLFKFKTKAMQRQNIQKTQLANDSNITISPAVFGRFESCVWSDSHLNIEQCRNKLKLTFCAYLNVLDETQRITIPVPFYTKYKWDLDRYYKMLPSTNNKECKIYSPNFMDNCWCLWFKKELQKSGKVIYIYGLQILKLPLNYDKGIMFESRVDLYFRSSDIDNVEKCVSIPSFKFYMDYRIFELEIKKTENKLSHLEIQIRQELKE